VRDVQFAGGRITVSRKGQWRYWFRELGEDLWNRHVLEALLVERRVQEALRQVAAPETIAGD